MNSTINNFDTVDRSTTESSISQVPLEFNEKKTFPSYLLLRIKSFQLQCLKTTVTYYYLS